MAIMYSGGLLANSPTAPCVKSPMPATYVVATDGNDENAGRTDATAFRSVSRCAEVARAGDTCFIRKGTYRETLRPSQSGTPTAPIVFRGCTGEKPVLTGLDELRADWSLWRGNIYRAEVSMPTGLKSRYEVFVDGQVMPEARFPDVPSGSQHVTLDTLAQGESGSASDATKVTIVDSDLNISGLEGARAVVWMGSRFTSARMTVATQSKHSLTLTGIDKGLGGGSATFFPGDWYMVYGKRELLDSPGEWWYDEAAPAPKLYLWVPIGGPPTDRLVEVRSREFVVDLGERSYVEVRDIEVLGGGIRTNKRSDNIMLQGLLVRHASRLADTNRRYNMRGERAAGVLIKGSHVALRDSEIAWSNHSCVHIEGNSHLLENNIIHDCSQLGPTAGFITVAGRSHRILRNTFYHAASFGILLWDYESRNDNKYGWLRDVEIAYNDISNFGEMGTDQGGIYGWRLQYPGTVIHHNWIHEQHSREHNKGGWQQVAAGIYFDSGGDDAVIHHNVLWDLVGSGFLAGGGEGRFYNNTVVAKKRPWYAKDTGSTVLVNNVLLGPSHKVMASTQHHNLGPTTDVSADSLFVSPKSGDFRPRSGAPIVDSGVDVGSITQGVVGKPDIGAYEYGRERWTAGAALDAAKAPPTSARP
jgi:hypothetical protein